jgi:RNA polymerase sigma-70 factor (ECF subfamily)
MGLSAAETNGRSHDTEELYREHGHAVGALCRSLLRDRVEAEDAAQQVFLSAHRALLNGAVLREPLAWLLAVARNECYGRFRQRAVAPVPAGETPEGATPDASVQVLRAGELASVWDEVGRMPPAQREAFLLREIRGLSYGQLAAELSLSPPSVRSLLLRARTRLRRRLGDVALGGAPWLQTLLRFVSGGDGPSPVPAATKAAAVGLGALALVGAGDLPHAAQHVAAAPRHTIRHQQAETHVRDVFGPAGVTQEDRARRSESGSTVEHARGRSGRSGSSGSDRSGSREGSDGSSGDGSSRSGSDDGDTTTVAQQTSSRADGDGSSSSTTSSSGLGSGSSDSRDSGSGGSGSSSNSGPDGGSSDGGSDGGSGPDGG